MFRKRLGLAITRTIYLTHLAISVSNGANKTPPDRYGKMDSSC
jgi:hypothetical protein